MKEDYIQNLLKFEELCENLLIIVRETYYKKDGSVKHDFFWYYPSYLQHLSPIKNSIVISDFLGIEYLERGKETTLSWVRDLGEAFNLLTFLDFKKALNEVKRLSWAKKEIKKAVSLLDSEEIDRLNEALHCFLEGCYYSSIAMSVSAIESRLFSLMMSKCPNSKLEEFTLGQLIREYLDNKQKYGNVIPKKHEPLLNHCNTYRIFSVHPKKEKINKPVASSILNMTFLFLLDKKLKREIKEEGK